MTSWTATQTTSRPITAAGAAPDAPDAPPEAAADLELELTEPAEPEVVHGYLPPAQPPGSIVIAYCGEPMVVRGEFTSEPPLDTCAQCVAIWRHERRAAERRAEGRAPGV